MKIEHLLWLASKNLNRHAFRSLLTILGIIFGVGSLVSMMAITEGARVKSLESTAELAIDNIILESIKPTASEGKQEPDDSSTSNDSTNHFQQFGLTSRDRNAFSNFENTQKIIGIQNVSKDIYLNGHKTPIKVMATEPDFFSSGRLKLQRGRFLSLLDSNRHQAVCVLGDTAAKELFPNRNPLKEMVQIGSAWFRVVGLIQAPTTLKFSFNTDLNNTIFIPDTTSLSKFGTIKKINELEYADIEYDALVIQVKSLPSISHTVRRAESFLKASHANLDYKLTIPYDLIRQKESTSNIFSIVMGTIAGISLIVGGIGVTNIMMANVYERTKEIGISLATGARQKDILLQFLFEALALTFAGGVLGLLIGYGISELVASWADWKTVVTPLALLGSLVISAGVGLISGTYPAYKASKLSPIEALRG